jgi:hypothetical protein
MPKDAPGHAFPVIADRDIQSGRPAVIKNFVGWVAKTSQPDRFVRPDDPAITLIEAGEECVIYVGGAHDLPIVAPFAAAGVGAKLWINPANDAVDDAATAGWLPLGVIQDIDTRRTPDVALVNTDALNAFMAAP